MVKNSDILVKKGLPPGGRGLKCDWAYYCRDRN